MDKHLFIIMIDDEMYYLGLDYYVIYFLLQMNGIPFEIYEYELLDINLWGSAWRKS